MVPNRVSYSTFHSSLTHPLGVVRRFLSRNKSQKSSRPHLFHRWHPVVHPMTPEARRMVSTGKVTWKKNTLRRGISSPFVTCYMFFSIYRRLFGITFAVNMSVFIGLTATHQANTRNIAYAVISNLFVSILMRQEYVVNTLFSIFTAWPQSTPLTIRRISARILHTGGRKC